MNTTIETLGIFQNSTIYKGRRDLTISIKRLSDNWIFDNYSKSRMVLIVPSQAGFSSKYFKDFLGFKYPNKSLIFLRRQRITHHELKSFIRRIYGATMITDSKYCHFVVSLLKECYKLIAKNSTYNDVINSAEYQKYKKEHQDPRTYVSRHTGKITFTEICTSWYRAEKYNYTIDEMLKHVKEHHKGKRVVYASLDSPFVVAFHKIQYPNLVILSAAKNNMKYLEEGLPEWIRPIEELYKADNKVLIKYKTAQYIKTQPNIEFDYYAPMPPHIRKRLEDMRRFIYNYDICRHNSSYYHTDATSVIDIIPADVYDPFMIAEFNELKPYLELSYKIEHNLSLFGGNAELEYYLLMKAKKIRLCYDYYKRVRERVTNILKSL